MKKNPVHTSTGCTACGTPVDKEKGLFITILARWIADLDGGQYRHPYLLHGHWVITRVSWIWSHCLMQEWFVERELRINRLNFKKALLAAGVIGPLQVEKTIDRVRHTGMVYVDHSVIAALAAKQGEMMDKEIEGTKKSMGFMYLAKRPCGKVSAMSWDDAGDKKEIAKSVASWIRRGDSVERVERFEGDAQPEWICRYKCDKCKEPK